MSLTLALNNALSGLAINQQNLAVISNNIANANTEGYSRQTVNQSAQVLNGVGAGVRIDDITRKIDKYLERAIQTETGNVGKSTVFSDYYDRMQILIGEPGSENSVDEYVQDFFDALQALAETADRTSYKSTAVNTGETLAREISGLAISLEDLRYQADQDIAEAVNYLNNELSHLSSLNVAINRAAALGNSTAGLLDQRDLSLERISEYMDVSITERSTGAIYVYTSNGVALVDENIHELSYSPSFGADALIEGDTLQPLYIYTYDEDGTVLGEPAELIGAVASGEPITSHVNAGILDGLQELRDVLIPDFLEQLDTLASSLRDEFNAIHNDGSSYPGAEELTGTRLVTADQAFDWSGEVRIAVLGEDGSPAISTYTDESYTGYRPLTLDLDFLDSGFGLGAGVPTMQTIINEINNHFNAPPVKAELNNLNNIQLVSNNRQTPQGTPPTFSFDFDIENIADFGSDFWITGVTVLDDGGINITNPAGNSDTIPRVAIDPLNSFSFTAGDADVTVNTTVPHNLSVGDRVFIEDPGTLPAIMAGNIPAASMTGYFEVVSVGSANSFEIRLATSPAATITENSGGTPFDVLPPYHELDAGEKVRTRDSGLSTIDFSLNSASTYYDITVNVGVFDNDPDNPNVQTGLLTYRVYNNSLNLYNDRYDISAVGGNAARVFPNTPHQYIFARLVDENGDELPNVAGNYGTQSGYLQLVANGIGDETFTIAIDELNSKQEGTLTSSPVEKGTERAFSHYFELNNFFVSNISTSTGDTIKGSAINMAVSKRVLDDPSLISTGDLEQSVQPADPEAIRLYTYERYAGDNSIAQRLAGLGLSSISFDAAGGLPNTSLSFGGYAGEMLGYLSSVSASATSTLSDNTILLEGFISRAETISGVNLDEELANTIIYQNAYSASARVITVTNDLFGELLGIF